MRWSIVVVLLLLVAGCAITDAQVKEISESIGGAVTMAAKPLIEVAAPNVDWGAAGGTGGVAGMIGGLVTVGVAALLRLIRKKPPVDLDK